MEKVQAHEIISAVHATSSHCDVGVGFTAPSRNVFAPPRLLKILVEERMLTTEHGAQRVDPGLPDAFAEVARLLDVSLTMTAKDVAFSEAGISGFGHDL